MVNVCDHGATGDGTTDDSAAIRTAIAAAVTAGGDTVYFPNGTYLVSQDGSNAWCIDLPSNITIRGQSRAGAIIKMDDGQDGFVRPLSAYEQTNISISRITIDGNTANQSAEEHRAGIFLSECTECSIRSVTSHHNSGDGIDIHSFSKDITIEDCSCYDNDRSGVAINGGGQERIAIRGCLLRNNGAQQIDTEFDSGYFARDVTIEKCHLVAGSGSDWALTISGSSVTSVSSGFVVSDNVIEGPIFVVWAVDVALTNNRITTQAGDVAPALVVFRRSDVRVAGNQITTNNTGYGSYASCAVEVQGVDSATDRPSVTLRDNTIVQNTASSAGVYLNNHIDALIDNNTVKGPSTGYSGIDSRVTVDHPSRSKVLTNNRIIDFARGVVCGSNTGTEELSNFTAHGNTFVQDENTSADVAFDLNADDKGVVKAAAMSNNSLVGVASMFGGQYGGRPTVPILLGGDSRIGGVSLFQE